ncbi:MAG: phosphatase PAP2 family protein [Oscillospiraceae bacterium]|nr:phosphatase PAP2 family protein [Candidatus Equicaccousia limihippi]
MKSVKKSLLIDTGLYFLICAAFTVAVKTVDLSPIGINGEKIGFSFVNEYFRNLFPYNEIFYQITQLIGYFAILVAAAFGVVGLVQLIKRKNLFKVDSDIIALGIFYILVMSAYFAFTKIAVNYRPVIVDAAEGLEASFPSSHTMLAVCVFVTASTQVRARIKGTWGTVLSLVATVLAAGMIVGRIISGVHWFTDIIGGILYSCFFISVYKLLCERLKPLSGFGGKHDR